MLPLFLFCNIFKLNQHKEIKIYCTELGVIIVNVKALPIPHDVE